MINIDKYQISVYQWHIWDKQLFTAHYFSVHQGPHSHRRAASAVRTSAAARRQRRRREAKWLLHLGPVQVK